MVLQMILILSFQMEQQLCIKHMQISALEVWHVNNEENNSQMCSLESGSADENIETMKAYMCKQRGMHFGSKISREEITKKSKSEQI